MSIYHKVRAVERVFNRLEKDLNSFQKNTGLKCMSGCGLCCHNPNITATSLEFLPFAYDLYKKSLIYQWFEDLNSNKSGFCRILNPMPTENDKGFCSHYQYRGLICRAFGFATMKNKLGLPTLVTCKTIKTEFPDDFKNATQYIESGKPAPLMSNYYHQLRSIDSDLGRELVPINDAIFGAIKVVLGHYAYRRPYRRRA